MKNCDSVDRIIQVKDTYCLGDNIKKIRKAAMLKQTDIVRMLQLNGIDISIYSYNRIEKGTQNPTISFLLEICRLLECDMNTLFDFS